MSGIEPSENGFGATRPTGSNDGLAEGVRQEQTVASLIEADERIAAQLHDRVICRIRGAELALAAVLGLGTIDGNVAAQLRDVIDELSAVGKDVRNALSGLWVRDRDPRGEQPNRLTIVKPSSGPAETHPMSDERRRYLCDFEDGQVFAYATPRGHDFFRATDHTPWAHESDGLLLSVRSGIPLAVRSGRVFRDVASDQPLYFERIE